MSTTRRRERGEIFTVDAALPFWNKLADYFPVRLHKSCDLDPAGNYLFGYHPHGIIGVGALITFATNADWV